MVENKRYRVVVSGRLREGLTLAEVQLRLATTFRLPLTKVESLFSGAPATLRSGVPHDLAQRYVKAVTAAGAECTLEAMTDPAPPVTSDTAKEGPAAMASSPSLVSRFWGRPLAFVLDMLLLGTGGAFLGSFCFATLAALGQAGRLIGLAVVLCYFGLLDSRIGRGQTLGKRLLKIRVVDAGSAGPISPTRSTVRCLLLCLPFFCNNLVLPFDRPLLVLLVTLAVFGLGGATGYLYLANRKSRQSLHDLVARTLVLRTIPGTAPPAARLWRGHLIVVGLWLLLVAVGAWFGLPQQSRSKPFTELVALQRALVANPGVNTARVDSGVTRADAAKTSWTVVIVSVREAKLLDDDLADEVAGATLASYPAAMRGDRLTVRLVYGYDIGIARRWQRRSYSLTPNQWVARLKLVEL